ncbi:MAG: nucleotidyltransferase domain-containing protein [bacterium]
MKININKLEKYFSERQDIAFAFLFGSQVNGRTHKLSDVDIAVYFYPRETRWLEFEEEIFYAAEDEIWADLESIVKQEVELLVLNRAPASVAASAIRGIPLAINDRLLYLRFMELITHVAEDFREFILNDYFKRNVP